MREQAPPNIDIQVYDPESSSFAASARSLLKSTLISLRHVVGFRAVQRVVDALDLGSA